MIAGIAVLYVAKCVMLAYWQKVLVLTGLFLLPPVSFDYRLIHLLLPLTLFLVEDSSTHTPRLTRMYVALFALLKIPKAYVFLYRIVSTSVVASPRLIVILVVLCLVEGRGKTNETGTS